MRALRMALSSRNRFKPEYSKPGNMSIDYHIAIDTEL